MSTIYCSRIDMYCKVSDKQHTQFAPIRGCGNPSGHLVANQTCNKKLLANERYTNASECITTTRYTYASGAIESLIHIWYNMPKAIPHKWVGAEANEFFIRCNGRFWRLTGGKSKNLQAADGGKGIAYAANELCGIALTIDYLHRIHQWHREELKVNDKHEWICCTK